MLAAGLLSWVNHQLPTISIPKVDEPAAGAASRDIVRGVAKEIKVQGKYYNWIDFTDNRLYPSLIDL